MLKVSPGIEPGLKDSKSLVIPLHHETNNMKNILVTTFPSYILYSSLSLSHSSAQLNRFITHGNPLLSSTGAVLNARLAASICCSAEGPWIIAAA